MTYDIIWEFQVPERRKAEFEAAYGRDGVWARLFAQAEGFVEVELLCCTERDDRYLTIDRWSSRAAFDAFQARFGADYKAMDERLEGLTATETRIGAFTTP